MHLNIRQKVIVGLVACVLAVGFIGGFSYHYLRAIEVKQHIVQIADDLREIVLEIRRYEKNYLLYGQEEDFQQNQRYTQQALERTGPDRPRCAKPAGRQPNGHLFGRNCWPTRG